MRAPFHPPTDQITLAGLMHALSDPVRLGIVARLGDTDGEICGDIGEGFEVHKSTLSHHYRVLREAGVTLTSVEGRNRVVRLRRDDLEARFPGLLGPILAALEPRGQ